MHGTRLEQMASSATEAALQARIRQQAVVAEVGRRALAGGELDALFRYTVDAVASALGAPIVVITKLEGQASTHRAAVGLPAELLQAVPPSTGPGSQLAFVATAREPVRIRDLAREDRFVPSERLLRAGAVSGLQVVVMAADRPWGVLSVFDTRQRSFSEEDVHFVQAVAHTLSAAIVRRLTEERLRESEARARAVLDTTVDAIITIDASGTIESFNRAAERIFGYRAAEVQGENVRVLMPEPYYSEHDDYLRSYRETGRRKIIGIGREVTGRRKDGSTFPMDLAVSEVDLGGTRLFTGIVRDISERRRLEQEVLRISDKERRRIGQDLHDGLGQHLTGIGLIARSLARRLRKEQHPEAATAEEITRMIREADEQARHLARGLVPVELGADGLGAALERLAESAQQMFGLRCALELHIDEAAPLPDPETATNLYRIAQEALSNAVRHGAARQVSIALTVSGERLRLHIHDDGSGIPENIASFPYAHHQGMGLHIMHYRARIVGGSLDVRPGPAGGTTVVFTRPPSSDAPAERGEALHAPHDALR